MDNKTKRILLFLFGCVVTRLLLVYIAYNYHKWLPIMGYCALAIGIAFLTIYVTGIRKTGPEVFGDRIWWNSLRPIHGGLYILFGILALSQWYKNAWIVLLADVLIGLVAFLWFHFGK